MKNLKDLTIYQQRLFFNCLISCDYDFIIEFLALHTNEIADVPLLLNSSFTISTVLNEPRSTKFQQVYHRTPLIWATLSHHVLLVKILIRFGASPQMGSERDGEMNNPIVLAKNRGAIIKPENKDVESIYSDSSQQDTALIEISNYFSNQFFGNVDPQKAEVEEFETKNGFRTELEIRIKKYSKLTDDEKNKLRNKLAENLNKSFTEDPSRKATLPRSPSKLASMGLSPKRYDSQKIKSKSTEQGDHAEFVKFCKAWHIAKDNHIKIDLAYFSQCTEPVDLVRAFPFKDEKGNTILHYVFDDIHIDLAAKREFLEWACQLSSQLKVNAFLIANNDGFIPLQLALECEINKSIQSDANLIRKDESLIWDFFKTPSIKEQINYRYVHFGDKKHSTFMTLVLWLPPFKHAFTQGSLVDIEHHRILFADVLALINIDVEKTCLEPVNQGDPILALISNGYYGKELAPFFSDLSRHAFDNLKSQDQKGRYIIHHIFKNEFTNGLVRGDKVCASNLTALSHLKIKDLPFLDLIHKGDPKNQTILHICAELGYEECISLLISFKMRLTVLDDAGHTPLAIAESKLNAKNGPGSEENYRNIVQKLKNANNAVISLSPRDKTRMVKEIFAIYAKYIQPHSISENLVPALKEISQSGTIAYCGQIVELSLKDLVDSETKNTLLHLALKSDFSNVKNEVLKKNYQHYVCDLIRLYVLYWPTALLEPNALGLIPMQVAIRFGADYALETFSKTNQGQIGNLLFKQYCYKSHFNSVIFDLITKEAIHPHANPHINIYTALINLIPEKSFSLFNQDYNITLQTVLNELVAYHLEDVLKIFKQRFPNIYQKQLTQQDHSGKVPIHHAFLEIEAEELGSELEVYRDDDGIIKRLFSLLKEDTDKTHIEKMMAIQDNKGRTAFMLACGLTRRHPADMILIYAINTADELRLSLGGYDLPDPADNKADILTLSENIPDGFKDDLIVRILSDLQNTLLLSIKEAIKKQDIQIFINKVEFYKAVIILLNQKYKQDIFNTVNKNGKTLLLSLIEIFTKDKNAIPSFYGELFLKLVSLGADHLVDVEEGNLYTVQEYAEDNWSVHFSELVKAKGELSSVSPTGLDSETVNLLAKSLRTMQSQLIEHHRILLSDKKKEPISTANRNILTDLMNKFKDLQNEKSEFSFSILSSQHQGLIALRRKVLNEYFLLISKVEAEAEEQQAKKIEHPVQDKKTDIAKGVIQKLLTNQKHSSPKITQFISEMSQQIRSSTYTQYFNAMKNFIGNWLCLREIETQGTSVLIEIAAKRLFEGNAAMPLFEQDRWHLTNAIKWLETPDNFQKFKNGGFKSSTNRISTLQRSVPEKNIDKSLLTQLATIALSHNLPPLSKENQKNAEVQSGQFIQHLKAAAAQLKFDLKSISRVQITLFLHLLMNVQIKVTVTETVSDDKKTRRSSSRKSMKFETNDFLVNSADKGNAVVMFNQVPSVELCRTFLNEVKNNHADTLPQDGFIDLYLLFEKFNNLKQYYEILTKSKTVTGLDPEEWEKWRSQCLAQIELMHTNNFLLDEGYKLYKKSFAEKSEKFVKQRKLVCEFLASKLFTIYDDLVKRIDSKSQSADLTDDMKVKLANYRNTIIRYSHQFSKQSGITQLLRKINQFILYDNCFHPQGNKNVTEFIAKTSHSWWKVPGDKKTFYFLKLNFLNLSHSTFDKLQIGSLSHRTKLKQSQFIHASFSKTHFFVVSKSSDFSHADCRESTFERSLLMHTKGELARFQNSIFKNLEITDKCRFKEASFEGVTVEERISIDAKSAKSIDKKVLPQLKTAGTVTENNHESYVDQTYFNKSEEDIDSYEGPDDISTPARQDEIQEPDNNDLDALRRMLC